MVDSNQRHDLNLNIEWTGDGVACVDPIGQGLVQTAGVFSKIQFVVDPLYFFLHREHLTSDLAVREIVTKVYFFVLVEPFDGHIDGDRAALHDRGRTRSDLCELHPSGRSDICPGDQHSRDTNKSTFWAGKKVD